MTRIFVPTTGAEDWKQLLADPEKQWRTGYSAKSLAYCWEDAGGFPPEVYRLFLDSEISSFQDIELVLAFPEYQVSLPGGRRPSQNDIFVLAKAQGQLIAITAEGKASEPFGPTLEEWQTIKSKGRSQRLRYLQEQLGLTRELPSHIRYQLLHRTVSALIEAERFNAPSAVMLVHSFSQNDEWFEDFLAFLELFDVSADPNRLVFVKEIGDVHLYCGWARGDVEYLRV
jgi:hypothetical protein